LGPGRLHALIDGVFAIALTLLVLDLPRPAHSAHLVHDLDHVNGVTAEVEEILVDTHPVDLQDLLCYRRQLLLGLVAGRSIRDGPPPCA